VVESWAQNLVPFRGTKSVEAHVGMNEGAKEHRLLDIVDEEDAIGVNRLLVVDGLTLDIGISGSDIVAAIDDMGGKRFA
ncbi:hypothetical protein TNCV_3349771, partial [Trichonephila clavipes]